MTQSDFEDSSRPVLVTGGGGFLGGAIVRRLVERGQRARSFSRGVYSELEALGVEQIQGDLADAEAVEQACRGCRLVFHAAAKAGVWGPHEEFRRANVVGTRNVVAACRKAGASRLVYTSSPSVVFDGRDMEGVDESVPYAGRFTASYPKTKAQAERETLQANSRHLATIALRPHLIWGPRDTHIVPGIIARGKSGKLRRIGALDHLVDFTYIDNAAHAHLLAAERLAPGSRIAGRAFFISDGRPVLLWEFINRILAAAGVPPVEKKVPRRLAYAAGWALETAYRILPIPGEPRLTRFLAEELSTAHWFDIGAARRELGYEPMVSVAEGLSRLGKWLSE